MPPPGARSLRATDGPGARGRHEPTRRPRDRGSALPGARARAMFSQQQQQQLQQLQQQQLQQLQQQQLLQLQQLFQQPPQQAPLPVTLSRGLPVQASQQQLLNLPASTSLLNSNVMQRALFLQQLQGLDQFAMPPAMYDSASLTVPTATLGNVRGYSLGTPSVPPPSLTPPQLATPNLQQFFPQATRQSLLGPPPVGVPIAPAQAQLPGRSHQKQARPSPTTNPARKDSSSQTMPVEGPLGSEEGGELPPESPDQDSPPCPDAIAHEKDLPAAEPESLEGEPVGPPAKRTKSSEPTAKGPPGQLRAKVQPQARMAVPKQTQTPELLPEPPEARVLPRFQPRALQIHAQVPPSEARGPAALQKQVHTQTSPERAPVPQQLQRREEAEPEALPQAHPQPPGQMRPLAQTQTCPPGQSSAPPAEQPRAQTQVPAAEGAPAPGPCAVPNRPPGPEGAAGGPEEPAGPQLSTEEPPQEPPGEREGERRSREMLGMWGAGGSLKVTIQQSSNSRAFSTTPVTPVPRPGDSTSTSPAATGPSPTQALHFFCCICKANCGSQQEFQEHMAGAEHQQRLGEVQHRSQACLLSLQPVPRDVLEREHEGPLPQRWCHTCQLYYMGDLIQHRRTQEHKIAKQSLRPFCTACDRYFKTPRKFVEHVKSQGHKDKAKELNMLQETAGQDEEHFITVDAVGCFEGDEEEEENEEEEDIEVEEELCKQMKTPDMPSPEPERKESETYSPSKAYGVDFLVPATGHVCRICHKFYPGDEGAQLSHCKSLAHFENLQKYRKAKKPKPAPARPVSRRCAVNARNALTALFTAGGRSPTQASSQNAAKAPSKMTAPPRPAPAPRRSSRLKT
ncbi:cip1-interacting zinc finger protein isoform X2 [Sorex araneus]|uniref:cip1-interacting zinc finger protein isoform X2 n=1 Tax=Sorex araneus TaxID=42254 RepID=UPI0024336596|nr:cip1-interacting zinc finger protein isoform X2 [Sorex araneus]